MSSEQLAVCRKSMWTSLFVRDSMREKERGQARLPDCLLMACTWATMVQNDHERNWSRLLLAVRKAGLPPLFVSRK